MTAQLDEPLSAVTSTAHGIAPIRSVLRATAILSSSSLVSILVGLVSAKAWAVLLGPSGLGFMGLLQALVGLAGLLAGTGIGTGLIRMGANALARGDYDRVAALRRATWLLFWGLGGLAVLTMVVFRVPVSQWMLGDPQYAESVVLMGLALLFSLASGVQVSLLNAYHRVKALAQFGILHSLVGTGISLVLVWIWHEQGIAAAIILNTAVGWALSSWLLRREVRPLPVRPTRQATVEATRTLLRFGLPYTASMLVGTGVQFVLPALVLHTLGTDGVGLYRAAVAISVTYLGFLLNAIALDYYPRVSAVSDQPAVLVQLVNQQHRLVLLLAVPMILGVQALAPFLIPLIYSPEFTPSVEVLGWQLIGDLLKFSSWTLGFVILARSSSLTIFCIELVTGINMLLSTWLGMRWFGLMGSGIGFLVTYIVHYLIVWIIVRRDIKLVWTTANKRMLLAAVCAALVVRGLPYVGLDNVRTTVAICFALLASIGSLYLLWQELGRDRLPSPHEAGAQPGGA